MTGQSKTLLLHPVRRRIIRRLHRDFKPHTVAELRSDLSLNSDQIRYHGDVLADRKLVKRFEGPDGLLIESRVADDPSVISILISTHAEDQGTIPPTRG